ncbi:MAG: hypothetical protein DRP11_03420 [Candidatus Aenigmatarchaeota archaeon]|nr:MAG: hypothetical protein DRP11_03420 [Candidatus Aenigmarchaeota archaeon]
MNESEIKEKIEKGWIRVLAVIEVAAVKKEVAEAALKNHIEKLKKEKGVILYREDYDEVVEVESPRKNIPKAYSQIVEIEFLIKNIPDLFRFVFLYGPSSIEILEPDKLKIDSSVLTDTLNTVAMFVHQYAAQGVGGIVLSPK